MDETLKIYGQTLDGFENTLTSSQRYMVYTNGGGTVKNLVIEGNNEKAAGENKRGLFNGLSSTDYATEDIIIHNVTVSGVGYALNMYGTPGTKLIVTDSSFTGWSSFTGFDQASFTNCHFGIGSYFASGLPSNGNLKPWNSVVLTDCTFDKGFCLDFQEIGTGTLTLVNCKVNGEVITAGNIKTLLGSANGNDELNSVQYN